MDTDKSESPEVPVEQPQAGICYSDRMVRLPLGSMDRPQWSHIPKDDPCRFVWIDTNTEWIARDCMWPKDVVKPAPSCYIAPPNDRPSDAAEIHIAMSAEEVLAHIGTVRARTRFLASSNVIFMRGNDSSGTPKWGALMGPPTPATLQASGASPEEALHNLYNVFVTRLSPVVVPHPGLKLTER